MPEPAIREQWAKRVERWKDSGLSAKQFATETGINARSLTWWRWHLAKGEARPKLQRRRRSSTESVVIAGTPTRSMMKFVEVPASVSREGLEVVLPSAIRICVRS